MTTERIREIQNSTAYPDSISVQQALIKVWNEVAQEYEGWKQALNFEKPEDQNEPTKFYVYVTEFCDDGLPLPTNERERILEIMVSEKVKANQLFGNIESQVKAIYEKVLENNKTIEGFKIVKILLAIDKYLA